MNYKAALKRLLKDNMFSRKVIGKRGALETNRLAMWRTSKNLFSKPDEIKGKKWNVELLIDASGSMRRYEGSRWARVIEAAEKVVLLLQDFVDFNIRMFCLSEKTMNAKEFLDIAEKERQGGFNDCFGWDNQYMEEVITARGREFREVNFGGSIHARQGNWEICNIVNAFEEIKHKEGGKIILIMFDGCPSIDKYGNNVVHRWSPDLFVAGKSVAKYNPDTYKEVVRRINKEVPIAAIGIQTTASKEYFPLYANLQDLSKTEQVIIRLLHKML